MTETWRRGGGWSTGLEKGPGLGESGSIYVLSQSTFSQVYSQAGKGQNIQGRRSGEAGIPGKGSDGIAGS